MGVVRTICMMERDEGSLHISEEIRIKFVGQLMSKERKIKNRENDRFTYHF